MWSEALTRLEWTTIFDVGLCVREKRGSESGDVESFNEAKLQWTNEATVDCNL